jgi:hypothetical protein
MCLALRRARLINNIQKESFSQLSLSLAARLDRGRKKFAPTEKEICLGMKFARKYISRLELLTYQRADKLKQEARHFAVCVIS